MASKIKQIRYHYLGQELKFNEGWSENIITNLGSVTQLGIYALPGTRFKINQANSGSAEELIINGSGIFSVNLEDRPITSISLAEESYNNIKSGQHFIIIDLIYEGGLG